VVHPAAATGFARSAEAYERGRPGYPDPAVDWLAAQLGPRVVDLAAGTGKLTRKLADRGLEVLAVEPIAEMRAVLARDDRVAVLAGTAEAIPLEDARCDAVTVAQAFHWFDVPRALAEIHRVLACGGLLAVVWNRRRMDDEIQRRVGALLTPFRGDVPAHAREGWRRAIAASELFEATAAATFDHELVLDGDGLVACFGSTSFVAALDDEPRDALLAQFRALAAGGAATLRFHTEVQVHRRREAPRA